MLDGYLEQLTSEELSQNTIEKYGRDIRFFVFQNREKRTIDKRDMIAYKNYLMEHYKASTVNSYLISINRYLTWLEAGDLTVKTLRIQRKANLENTILYRQNTTHFPICNIIFWL